MRLALTLIFITAGTVAGVVFRPFWQSEWGIPTFIVVMSIAVSLAAGYGGKGKPYSLSFGFAVGGVLAISMFLAVYVNQHLGILVGAVLFWLGTKTQLYGRRLNQLSQ